MADQDNFDASALLRKNPRQRLARGDYYGEPLNVNQGDGDSEERFPESTPEFTPLKMYLRLTGLWYPSKAAVEEEAIWKGVVKTFVQLIILGGLILNYCYELGAFHSQTLVEKEYIETVTTVKNVIWFSRLPVMYTLGMFYFRKPHLYNLLQKVNSSAQCWGKAKKAIYKSFFPVIVFAFVVPLSSKGIQMIMYVQGKKHQDFTSKEIIKSLVFSALARFFSLPVVFVFVLVVCIISTDARHFKRAIQEWTNGEEEARNRFINIKRVIERAQKAFQPFLITQLVFLCVLLLPSIFSVIERIQDEATYKMTLIGPSNIKKASRNDVNTGNAIFVNSTASSLRLEEGEGLHSIRPPQLFTVMKSREQAWRREVTEETKLEASWQGIVIVVCGGLSDFLEMFIVYSLPLVLLTKLHNTMTTLPEVVQNLEFAEQIEKGFLFQGRRVVKDILKDLSSAKGIQILRMNLTGVKAVFITLLMPFLTTAFNLLFLDVKLKS